MKSKISKILGPVISVSIIFSLMVTAALPVGADLENVEYSIVSTPSIEGNVLVEDIDIDFMAASADGMTIFCYDDEEDLMYKSTDGGVTFGKPFAVGDDEDNEAVDDAVALVISPNFASDSTVVLVEEDHMWMSVSGGGKESYNDVASSALEDQLENGTVTSADIGYYFSDNTLSVILGVAGGDGEVSNVLKFKAGGYSFAEVGDIDYDVYAVKFSTNHMSDAEILCVYVNDYDDDEDEIPDMDVFLASKIGTDVWGLTDDDDYPPLLVAEVDPDGDGDITADIEGAIIALPPDYIGNQSDKFLVALQNDDDEDGTLFLISGREYSAGSSKVKYEDGEIQSISVSSDLDEVYFGLTDDTEVYRSSDITSTSPDIDGARKDPSGESNANVIAVGGKVLCGTAGDDSALSVSTDGAVNFNQLSLIDVVDVTDCSLDDVKVVDEDTMFLLMKNLMGEDPTVFYLFKTTDGGDTWLRIRSITTPTLLLAISPEYADDTTIGYSADGSNMINVSTDGGESFGIVGTADTEVSALYIGADSAVYVGGEGADFYKAGRWTNATKLSGDIVSIAFNADGDKIAVGNTNGQVFVSTNDGVSFTEIKTEILAKPGADGESMYVTFATDGNLYALGDDDSGIFLLEDGEDYWADPIEDGIGAGTGIAVADNGVLYASDSTAGAGVWRSLTPTARNPEFHELCGDEFPSMFGPTGDYGTGVFSNLQLLSGDAANTFYSIETSYDDDDYGYAGRLFGFVDTFIGKVSQSSPANNTDLTSTSKATLAWNGYTDAKNYQVVIDTVSDFSSDDMVKDEEVDDTSVTFTSGLSAGKTYYWKVRAVGVTKTGTEINTYWSDVRSFTMALNQPVVDPVQLPEHGATNVAIDTTFSWPVPSGNPSGVTYVFQIAEELGNADKFSIIDTAANCSTNAYKLESPLKYDTQYWWRVKSVTSDTESSWTVSFFTTEKEPVTTTPVTTTQAPPQITVTVEPQEQITPIVTVTVPETKVESPIPTYLLWIVVAVGAILFIAVIVLIVRTRRIS